MKKVVKVSIGNIAFTLDEDAYKVISDYLSSLEYHYRNNPNCREIIDSIEERIAELLIEKGGKEGIVLINTAQQVVDIVGKPEDIDDEIGNSNPADPESNTSTKRKLFRDMSNTVVGGVCSGLGVYFGQDALLFRVLFVLFAIGFSIFGWNFGGFGFMVLLYVVMWMVIPAAVTTEQRCAMKGESLSYQDIQKNVERGARNVADRVRDIGSDRNFWDVVGRVFTIFIGLIMTVIGLTGVSGCIVAFFGLHFLDYSLPAGLFDTLAIFSGSTATMMILFKVFLLLTVFLPFIAMLYGGIQMLFGFKSPRWRPGLVMFIIWLISVLGIIGMSVGITSRYWNSEDKVSHVPITPVSDTIYVEYNDLSTWKDEKIIVDANRTRYNLLFIDNSDKQNVKLALYPEFKLEKGENNVSELIIKTNLFENAMSLSELEDASQMQFYSFDGKTLKLDPMVIEKGNRIKEGKRKVELCVDDSVTVIVNEPIYHQFDRSFDYSNMKFFKCHHNIDIDF